MENGKVEIALSKFRKPYNCAQTVYAAFKGGDAEGLEELSKCGGGKAPEGLCGALYSAVKLCTGAADKIRAELFSIFAAMASSLLFYRTLFLYLEGVTPTYFLKILMK